MPNTPNPTRNNANTNCQLLNNSYTSARLLQRYPLGAQDGSQHHHMRATQDIMAKAFVEAEVLLDDSGTRTTSSTLMPHYSQHSWRSLKMTSLNALQIAIANHMTS